MTGYADIGHLSWY